MSITTRDLKLRQKEVDKNLNETYSTLRKQPEGGLGAMIQKPNHFEPPLKRVPTLFTPSPMLSSLPYLAEWVKYRSNEVALNTTAHLIRQREAAKASIIYDDIKQNNLDMRNEEVSATVSRNFAPSTTDLLRKYLSNEIDKSRDEERKIQEQRMKRMDLQMNPVRPEAPAVAPPLLRTLTAGDMGRPDVPDQAGIRDIRSMFHAQRQRQEEAERVASVAEEARDQGVKRKFTNLAEGLIKRENGGNLSMVQQLRQFKESELSAKLGGSTAASLKEMAKSIGSAEERPAIEIKGERRPASGSELKNKSASIPTLIAAKAKGIVRRIPFDVAGSPLVPTTGAGRPPAAAVGGAIRAEDLGLAAGGGGGGGGAAGGRLAREQALAARAERQARPQTAEQLRRQEFLVGQLERMQKGII